MSVRNLLLILAVSGLAVLAFALLRPGASGADTGSATAGAGSNPTITPQTRITINGVDRTDELLANAALPLSTQRPEEIRLAQIKYIDRQGALPVLVFIDDSHLTVTPLVLERLDGNIRVRINYDRNKD